MFNTAYSILYNGTGHIGSLAKKTEVIDRITDFHPTPEDVVVLHGGEDVSPHYYNQNPGPYMDKDVPSQRDKFEWACINKAVESGAALVGICRGAQFLCIKAGGSLVQHVDNHCGQHLVKLLDGRVITTNSIHHQMMIPTINSVILGWAETPLSKRYCGEHTTITMPCEPEIVLFPHIRALGIQGHPEMMGYKEPLVQEMIKIVCNEILI